MKRIWIIVGVIAALVAAAVAALVFLDVKFELRLAEYDDDAIDVTAAPQVVSSPPDVILASIGLGLVALAVTAVAYTAWALAKQILLIRRGRPDSR